MSMQIELVTSRDNRHIKQAVKLRNSGRLRRELGLFVLEGARLCGDANASGVHIDSLFFTDDARAKYDAVEGLIAAADSVYCVSDAVFDKLAETAAPQGVMCICRMPEGCADLSPTGRYIACENLSDPSNLGALARTAEALGSDGLILLGGGCDPYSPKAQRAAMGSLLRLPIFRFDDAVGGANELIGIGLKLYAAVVDSTAASVGEAGFGDGSVIVIGNEGNGMSERLISVCQNRVYIPISGRAESFNAAAAATILLWEQLKERSADEQ